MATANENIRDALIRHQVSLQRLSAGLGQEAVAILDKTESQLVADIETAIANGATVESDAGLRKLQRLEDVVRAIRTEAIDTIAQNAEDSAIALVRHEAEFTANTLDGKSPVLLDLTLPNAATLAALVTGNPFEGQLLSTWMDRLAEDDATRIVDAVKVGMTRGLSTDDILRSVVGNGDFNGADGTTQITRNRIGGLLRTAVNAFSNMARNQVVLANRDVVEFERYTATLDSHTTIICAGLDGNIYKVDEGRFPPQHFGCRSIRVPALSPTAIGDRPMKPYTERTLVSEFADANGLDAITRDDIQRGLKGAFDTWARARVREMAGTTAASTTYSQFLRGQSAAFQDEVLGATKAALFRDGGLPLSGFTNRAGGELTLAQLAQSEAAAFRKAGIDPANYKVS